jgi:hypothetical protein
VNTNFLHQIPLVANGNIRPGRFLTGVAGTNYVCVEAADDTIPCLGVSARWTRYAAGDPADDGYHAIAGEQVSYAGPLQRGEVLLGTDVTDLTVPLVAVTDGTHGAGCAAPAPSSGTDVFWLAALPEKLGVDGEYIPVLVLPPTPHRAALA